MFGMGFTEILVIAIIAVIFLGPDKLPETMVNIAKFFRSMKSSIASAKASLDEELNIEELRREALQYKEELMSARNELDRANETIHDQFGKSKAALTSAVAQVSLENEPDKVSEARPEEEKAVTFEKKKKKKNKVKDETDSSQEPAPDKQEPEEKA